jgi:hypothetical protein
MPVERVEQERRARAHGRRSERVAEQGDLADPSPALSVRIKRPSPITSASPSSMT